MASSIPFPATTHHKNNSSLSLLQTTSLEVCHHVYGDSSLSPDSLARYYEPNAVYENPFITATTRSVIADIFQLSQQLRHVDVKSPTQTLAMFFILFRLKLPRILCEALQQDPWFRALHIWTDLDDVCESESFDGHRKCVVEHTLNVLILPSLHVDRGKSPHPSDSIATGSSHFHQLSIPALSIPGISTSVPSPLHLQLHVITRLSFNEQGRITHHRDFWDVKDLMGLIPGVSLAQWIGTRLAATGLSYLLRYWQSASSSTAKQAYPQEPSPSTDYASTPESDIEAV
jgi:hypothetical protein